MLLSGEGKQSFHREIQEDQHKGAKLTDTSFFGCFQEIDRISDSMWQVLYLDLIFSFI